MEGHPTQSDIFENPKNHVGQVSELCGYLTYEFENNNFYENKKAARKDEVGLGITADNLEYDGQLRKLNKRRLCVSGEVYREGCGKEYICTGSEFEYAIRVKDILRR